MHVHEAEVWIWKLLSLAGWGTRTRDSIWGKNKTEPVNLNHSVENGNPHKNPKT